MFKFFKPVLLSLLLFANASFSLDPMKPPAWSAVSEKGSPIERNKFKLQQILNSKNRSVAIINDTLVVPGQVIDGATVTQITGELVKVRYKGRIVTLTMKTENMTSTTKEFHREK